MKDAKAPTSRSYQEFLLESLRNAQEAAGYIEVTLTEASDEPKLLQMVLKDVVDSRLKFNNLSESAQLQWEKLDKMLTESAGSEISSPHSAVLALMTKDYHTFSVGKISVPTFSNFSIIFLRFWRNIINLNLQIFPNIFLRQYLN